MLYLAEITYVDPTSLQPTILRYSSGKQGFMTLPADSPGNTWYEPRLKVPSDFQTSVFKDGVTGGSATGGYGTCELINQDGALDFLMGEAFDGRQIRILYGDETKGYSSFQPILTGTMCQPQLTWKYLTFLIRDYTELFDKPISAWTFLGNNVGGVGIQGTPNDYMGKTLPVCLGHCLGIQPAWVSQGGMIYMVHGYGPIKAVDAVYSNGIIMPLDCSVGGTVESAAATYTSAQSFTLTGVNKTGAYTAGLLLYITQAAGSGNMVVVSSTYTGGNTVVTIAVPSTQALANTFSLTNAAITQIAYGGGDCVTLAALQAATPAAGCFCTCLALGLFKISGGTGTTITCDARGDASGGVYVNTVAGIIQRIAQNYIQWPRTNIALYSEQFANAAWTETGVTVGGAASSVPIAGMGTAVLTETGAAGHNLTQNLTTATGMYCYSIFTLPNGGRTTFRLKMVDGGNSANYCSADFDLVAMTYSNVKAVGLAVGPNWSATGFITAAGLITYPNGWMRLWIAGQPNSTLTTVNFVLEGLSGGSETYTDSASWGVGGAMFEFNFPSPHIYTGPTLASPVTGYDPLIGPSLNMASFTALATAIPYDVGYYVAAGDTTTAADVMNALCGCGGAFWGFDRSGNLYVNQFVKPLASATPVAIFGSSIPLQDTLERSAPFNTKDGTPAYRVQLNAVHNWTPLQPASIASSLWTTNPTWVSWLGLADRVAQAEDLNAYYLHPLGSTITAQTYIADMTDAMAEANRMLTLYKGTLDRFTLTTKIDQGSGATVAGTIPLSTMLSIMIGSIIRIQDPRFNLSAGRNFVVVGVTESHKDGKMTLEVLG
jgi:hypothetical protein